MTKCPAYYDYGEQEPFKVMEAWAQDSALPPAMWCYLGFCLKYIARAGKKTPDVLVDLHKAKHCLQRAIDLIEEEPQS